MTTHSQTQFDNSVLFLYYYYLVLFIM